jgi:ABC-type Fe3+ transport system permease subunit
MRFFHFVSRPWLQYPCLLPVIVVAYLGALAWLLLRSRKAKASIGRAARGADV